MSTFDVCCCCLCAVLRDGRQMHACLVLAAVLLGAASARYQWEVYQNINTHGAVTSAHDDEFYFVLEVNSKIN